MSSAVSLCNKNGDPGLPMLHPCNISFDFVTSSLACVGEQMNCINSNAATIKSLFLFIINSIDSC